MGLDRPKKESKSIGKRDFSKKSLNPHISSSFWRAYYITCGHRGPVQTKQKGKKGGRAESAQSRLIPIPIVCPPPPLLPRSLCTFHSTKCAGPFLLTLQAIFDFKKCL
jgi:hypothetical protein